jgi:hypothetical protein
MSERRPFAAFLFWKYEVAKPQASRRFSAAKSEPAFSSEGILF